jgi:hypothetical protein
MSTEILLKNQNRRSYFLVRSRGLEPATGRLLKTKRFFLTDPAALYSGFVPDFMRQNNSSPQLIPQQSVGTTHRRCDWSGEGHV